MLRKRIAALLLAVPLTAASTDVLVFPRPQQPEPLRFFGNRTIAVPLLIHAPRTDGLTLRAQLVQLTANLSVPIGDSMEVPLGSGAEVDFPVPLPAVQRKTDFELRIRSRSESDPGWQPAGRIGLCVYPSGLLDPIRKWAQSHALRVEEDDDLLTEFLRQEGIRIAGAGKAPDVTLYAGKRLRGNRPRPSAGPIVRFSEREVELPLVVVERSGGGAAVTVEMRLLDRLATDPQAQKVFLEVFRLLHQKRPSTKGKIK